MSKVLYILDPGHGGLHPETKQYVTAGKRMVKDGIEFYEGVNNRDNVKRIIKAMSEFDLECIDIVNTWRDIPLSERVAKANKLAKGRKAVYISIHSDANGNGRDWDSANGIGSFVYRQASAKSRELAKYLQQELTCNFDGIAKDRKIKEASFYVLAFTNMPAVLLEIGFHTNKTEVQKMTSEDWKQRLVKSVVDACLIFENNA